MKADSPLARAAVAAVSGLLAIVLHSLLGSVVGPGAALWLCFISGVLGAAWFGGFWPGLLAAAILLADLARYLEIESMALFAAVSVAVAAAMHQLHKATGAARQAQTTLTEVLESTLDAVIAVDPEFRCLYVNPQAARLAGKTPNQIVGRSLRTVFPETPSTPTYRELGRALRERAPVWFESQMESGSWYEFNAYPVPHGLSIFVRDIGARKAAEAERLRAASVLETENFRLEALLREMPVGVIIVDAAGKVESANPAAIRMFDEPIRKGDSLLTRRGGTLTTPEGRVIEPADRPVNQSLRTGRTIRDFEVRYLRHDGAELALLINAIILAEPDGGLRGALATYTDITHLRSAQKALRESESRLARLFDSPAIGFVSGNEKRILDANDAFLRMLGYDRRDLEAGLEWTRIVPPEHADIDAKGILQLTERGFTDSFEREFIAKDGRRISVQAAGVSFEAGKWSPWVCYVLDLTEHRRIEARLRERARLDSVGVLAGGVAHDFNNILTSIMGNASFALEIIPPAHPAREPVELALRATERAADLTRQLLAYAGKGRFSMRSTDVTVVTRDIAQLIRASIPRSVDLVLNLADSPPPVLADPTQIQQLVMNLVINGAEAIGDAPGTVRVATEGVWVGPEGLAAGLTGGEYVRLTVEDTGCGMDEATRSHIFDPFFTTKFTGRGLGLAASLGVVRSHNGAIDVESSPGGGSTFRVYLPVSRGAVSQGAAESEVPDEEPLAQRAQGTVLVVEAEKPVRETVRATLGRHGYTVIAARDGREALTIFRGLSHSVSLVLLDAAAPSFDATLRGLEAIRPSVKVVVGGADADLAARLTFDPLVSGLLPKPYQSSALVARVHACLSPAPDSPI